MQRKKSNIVSYTFEELERMPSRTDWAKVAATTQAEVEAQIAEDPDDWIADAGGIHPRHSPTPDQGAGKHPSRPGHPRLLSRRGPWLSEPHQRGAQGLRTPRPVSHYKAKAGGRPVGQARRAVLGALQREAGSSIYPATRADTPGGNAGKKPANGRAYQATSRSCPMGPATSSRRRFARRWARGPPARFVVEGHDPRRYLWRQASPRSRSTFPTATSSSRSTAAASSPPSPTIDVNGEKVRVIPRDFQLDPVSDRPLHVDFLRVIAGSTITVEVPVQFINEAAAPGIRRGGVLNVVRHRIAVRLPGRRYPGEDRRRPDRPRHQRLAAHLQGRRCPKAFGRPSATATSRSRRSPRRPASRKR